MKLEKPALIIKEENPLTSIQLNRVFDVATDIIQRLPPKTLDQMLGGYSNDIDMLLKSIVCETEQAMNFGRSLDTEKIGYIDNLESAMDERLRIQSWNYFNATVLSNFTMGWRNLEWANLVQLFPWSSFLCSRSSGKSHCRDTEVVMYDGSIKMIQDIVVGDIVMGPDSTPRNVLEIHSGESPMYKVHQTYADDYVVNEGHPICCIYDHLTTKKSKRITERIKKFIPVEEIPKHAGYNQRKIFGYRVDGWELSKKELSIEPYFLGLWLGDGNSNNQSMTNPEEEVKDYLKGYAERLNLDYRDDYANLFRINIKQIGSSPNKLLDFLREHDLIDNKHIPDIYMKGSRQQRLELLAGILDSDGHLNQLSAVKKIGKAVNAATFELSLHKRELILQVRQLALSLGFRCLSVEDRSRDIKLKKKREEYVLKDYEIWRIYISGQIWNIPTRVKRKIAIPYEKVQSGYKSSLTIESIGTDSYYGFACDKDHLFLLSDGTVVHNSFQFVYAFCLWRLYSYTKPIFYNGDTIDNKNRKETALITNTMTLAEVHVGKIIEEIRTNPILCQKLNPNGRAKLGSTGIETEIGSILHVRGKDGFIRGLHVGAAVVDDLPDESSIYSDEQREKLKELFRATITPIVESYGYLLVSGTPYSTAPNELYNVLKKDKRFASFEYPIIFPDGRSLAPDRFTFNNILGFKEELGTMVFSREYLVVPISDNSTIFPYSFLMRSTVGMENIGFADSIDFFPIKLRRVIIGCDFATSGNIGADYTVYTVWGVDSMNNYYLVAIHRQKGMSHNEQVDKIVLFDRLYKPNKIVCEANGFQGILSSLARERGLKNIEQFTTTEGNKKDLYTGLPSLSAMFERGQIRIPFKEGPTKEVVHIIFSEFSSISFRSDRGKLEAVSGHDDIPMSCFIAINSLREGNTSTFKMDLI